MLPIDPNDYRLLSRGEKLFFHTWLVVMGICHVITGLGMAFTLGFWTPRAKEWSEEEFYFWTQDIYNRLKARRQNAETKKELLQLERDLAAHREEMKNRPWDYT